MTLLTDGQVAELVESRIADRLKRKAMNKRRYNRRYERIRAARAAGQVQP